MLTTLRTLSSLTSAAILTMAGLVLTSEHAQAHQHDVFQANLNGASVVPPSGSAATGFAVFTNSGGTTLRYYVEFSGLTGTETSLTIHGFAPPGTNAPVLYTLPLGTPVTGSQTILAGDVPNFLADLAYVSVETSTFPGGEIRGQIVHQPAAPWTGYCFGDGSGTPCPCGNNALPGYPSGCLHSLGYSAFMDGHGASTVLLDNLRIVPEGLPPTAVTALLQGTTRANGGAGTAFGDGLMCVGGTVVRIGVVTAVAGVATFPDPAGPRISVLGGCHAGDVRTYQAWYRNPPSFCSPDGFNLSEGLEITWVP